MRIRYAVLIAGLAGIGPAAAQMTPTPAPAPAEAPQGDSGGMSCDDMIVDAELKIQPVIEQEEKVAAVAHVRAAQAAIAKGDTATCKAEIAKALAVVAKGSGGY
ncbi:MAG: hypothetical protein J0H79_16435 [Alphaproteobacteria bacterium]|nr:hypothetical protein [Alphaproteobacteria bacterium]